MNSQQDSLIGSGIFWWSISYLNKSRLQWNVSNPEYSVLRWSQAFVQYSLLSKDSNFAISSSQSYSTDFRLAPKWMILPEYSKFGPSGPWFLLNENISLDIGGHLSFMGNELMICSLCIRTWSQIGFCQKSISSMQPYSVVLIPI